MNEKRKTQIHPVYKELPEAARQQAGDLPAKLLMGVEMRLEDFCRGSSESELDEKALHQVKPTKIMEIGAEGGSITLWGYDYFGRKVFSIDSYDSDCSSLFLDKEDRVGLHQQFQI